ncbi:MAG: methyltransferase, partial [Candidatus Woesearchaeota archaeon]|nr:methyltransferase [Candidatus Woesearchaeota archaeon]
VIAADIQKEAIEECKRNIKNIKVKFIVSDLFENIPKKKFDTIIFNPPYLPEDIKLKDITVEGGKKGYETLERFFNYANGFLKPNGVILIVFSSLTNKAKVNEFIENHLLEFKELERQRIFFEELYVYMIRKSALLKKLEANGITNIKRLAKGHRGLIFAGKLGKRKVAVKIQRKDIDAKGTVNREAKILKILNKYNIGPKVVFSGDNFFVYYFIEGKFIEEFLKNSSKEDIIKVLRDIFMQCCEMDRLGINKEEMNHPYKHIIIGKNRKAFLLDFERARKTKNPHNVTQFCQYVTSGKFNYLVRNKLSINKEKIIKAAKAYKKQTSKKNLNDIIKLIDC